MCLSCMKFQRDPNPNAITLEGATPLEGTRAFWQLKTAPRGGGALKRNAGVMYPILSHQPAPPPARVGKGAAGQMQGGGA